MAELPLPFESRYFPLKKFFNVYQRSMEEPEEFWVEQAGNRWIRVERSDALAVQPKAMSYGLGLFVLEPKRL